MQVRFQSRLNAQLCFFDEAAVDTIEHIKPFFCVTPPSCAFLHRAIEMACHLIEREGVTAKRTIEVCLSLFSVFYSAADYAKAEELIQKSGIEKALPICKFLVDVTHNDPREISEQFGCLTQQYADSNRVLLIIKINYMSYLMRNAQSEIAKMFAEEVLAEKSFLDLPEYWWMLKLHASYVSPVQRVIDLRKAVKKLEALGSMGMAARTKVTLAAELARVGSRDEALNLLVNDQKHCAENHCRTNVYLNNIAATYLAASECTNQVLENLQAAKTYVTTPYERMLITCNELVALTLLERWADAKHLAEQLENFVQNGYPSTSYQHARDTNLMFYYEKSNNHLKADIVKSRLQSLRAVANSPYARCIDAQLKGVPLESGNNLSYVTRLGYRPTFIGYWQCELERSHINEIVACQLD